MDIGTIILLVTQIAGVAFLFGVIHGKINGLDKRVNGVEKSTIRAHQRIDVHTKGHK